MKAIKWLIFFSFLLLPSAAFAWGPLTHMYLGSEVLSLSLAPLLPQGIYALIRKFRHDFLYGNIIADIIIGKKYLPEDRNPHSWEMALNLFRSAETSQQKAFMYGYISHLAADTVAHGTFTLSMRNISHTLVELRADSLINKKYWYQAVTIGRKVQQRNDLFLKRSLERVDVIPYLFSFKANKRIFKSMLILSCFNKEGFGDLIQRNALDPAPLSRISIELLHLDSIARINDVLRHGKDSEVIRKSPIAGVR
jgi:hypothetical protein